uniref:Methyltransferase FkbM domain-containing protein n=1 Tax=Haptolina ericina TaxID=156174 RepID=A0A7S3AYP6_9EUKA|mmetsp:Transcript_42654/g.96456  ORF Transcript_42654/g.96456 Transcript_42654/m.96456 type:complete len:363 (+) Transcript_42654:15-1103(+)
MFNLLAHTHQAKLTASSRDGLEIPQRDVAGMEPTPLLKSNSTRLHPIWQPVLPFAFVSDMAGRWHSKEFQDMSASTPAPIPVSDLPICAGILACGVCVLLSCAVVFALLGNMSGGYFIDLAANHPVFISNTRALERDHGWRGLCIEANPRYWTLIRAVRQCTLVGVAVSDTEATVRFVDEKKGGMGKLATASMYHSVQMRQRVNGEFATRTLPFSQVISSMQNVPHTIDYMSLDVEGAEVSAMSSFPFASHQISLMTVEWVKRTKQETSSFQKMMKTHGYQFLCRNKNDHLWVHNGTRLSAQATSWIVACRDGTPDCAGISCALRFGERFTYDCDVKQCYERKDHSGSNVEGVQYSTFPKIG